MNTARIMQFIELLDAEELPYTLHQIMHKLPPSAVKALFEQYKSEQRAYWDEYEKEQNNGTL